MRSVLLASLRTHARRFLAAGLAVGIGVAFVVVTAGLVTAARSGIEGEVGRPYAGADLVLSYPSGDDAVRLVREAPSAGAAASIVGGTRQPVAHDGVVIARDVAVGSVPVTDALRWQALVDGAFPGGPGEAAVDADRAEEAGVALGDTITVGTGSRALEVRVVGLVDEGGFLGSGVYLTVDDLATWPDELFVDAVAWAGSGSLAEQRADIAALVPYADPVERAEFVADRVVAANQGVDVIAVILLLFATVALVVSVLVIANTFSILLAQRLREIALLRCVGATCRQLSRSLRVEALALGLVATAAGLVVGTALAHGVVAVVGALVPDLAIGRASVPLPWYAAAASVGLVVTLVASWLPTRRTVRSSPLAGLRPQTASGLRTTAGRLRVALGVLLVAAGTALLAVAVAGQVLPAMLLGGTAVFVGVLVLGPLLVPALVRRVGAIAARVIGLPGRLATDNAVRNPRRTAATTASLLIGVTLTTAVLTGLASSRTALTDELDRQHPLDSALTSAGAALPADLPDAVAALPGVARSAAVPGTSARVAGSDDALPVLAPGDDELALARDASVLRPGDGEVLLPWDQVPGDVFTGDRVTVVVGEASVRLRVTTGEGFGAAALVTPATLERLGGSTGAHAVWASAEDGADADALLTATEALAGPLRADVVDGLGDRSWVDLQLDVLTGVVVGLLGVAVLIALLGIANTLGLSVLERGRENALLRALGLTRRQLRATLAAEAALLSVAATLLGTALGTAFAWVGVRTLVTLAVDEAPLVLPWGQLALVVAVSAVAGLLAGVLPARRAARTAPAAGLALD